MWQNDKMRCGSKIWLVIDEKRKGLFGWDEEYLGALCQKQPRAPQVHRLETKTLIWGEHPGTSVR